MVECLTGDGRVASLDLTAGGVAVLCPQARHTIPCLVLVQPNLHPYFVYANGKGSDEQGSHRLEKYLNVQDCLEKSLKIKFSLKSTGKTLKDVEKSLNFTIYRRIQHYLWRPKSV